MIESKLEDPNPIASLPGWAVDAGLMRAIPKIRLPKAPRLPSVAGNGLPERMRTTAFAFLGLTAAAGLALVAIFAQLSFHVLTPAPLPDEPVSGGAVAEAVPLHRVAVRVPTVTGREAPAATGDEIDRGGAADGGHGGTAPSEVPAAAAPAPSEGGVDPGSADASTPKPASTSAPAPDAATQESPAQSSGPAPSPTPKPAPIPARPASPTPPAPTAPGNSQSSAAAAHASDRGIEASSKSTASVEPQPPVTGSSSPSPEAAGPGNGNGKALGQTK